MTTSDLATPSKSLRNDPVFVSKKRRRSKMGQKVSDEQSIRRLPVRAACAMFLVLISSNGIQRSNGFGSPISITTRSTSLNFAAKGNPGGYEDDKEKKANEIEELFEFSPSDGFGSRTPKNQPRTSANNGNNRRKNNNNNRDFKKGGPSSSLLPPPMGAKSSDQNGLSSWEDFLGGTTSTTTTGRRGKNFGDRTNNDRGSSPSSRSRNNRKKGRRPPRSSRNSDTMASSSSTSGDAGKNNDMLPSIADLFPSNFSTSLRESSKVSNSLRDNLQPSPSPTLEGVLPVSDLFYRSSSQNKSLDEDNDQQRDDEELPFSAEQSNDLTSSSNKIKIRRNRANRKNGNNNSSVGRTTPNNPNNGTGKKKKLQRRGMEMLVGGVPINADPPQRSVELSYKKTGDWKDVITTNSRDFGPMFYGPSVGKLSDEEKGLYCEYFVNSTLKWNVCPKDLRSIANKGGDTLAEETSTDDGSAQGESDGFASAELEGDLSSNTMKEALRNRMVGSLKEAFRKASNVTDDDSKAFAVNSNAELSGELVFSIGVSIEELENQRWQ